MQLSMVSNASQARVYIAELEQERFSHVTIENHVNWHYTRNRDSQDELSLRLAVSSGWVLLVLKYGDKVQDAV